VLFQKLNIKEPLELTIIIINYNVCNEVDNCLESIYKLLKNIDFEVIVVDNNSPNRDILALESKYPQVNFEFLNENLGFGKANNYGINISKGKYILFLNPDTVIVQDFVSPIVDFIKNNKSAGACGPMLVYEDLNFQNSFGNRMGLLYETAEAFMFISAYRKLFRLLRKKDILAGNVIEVGWLSGACILIKTDLVKKVNGFDADYFLNYEDIDLCRKVEELGYNNYYFPAYKCIHLDHSSQNKNYENLVLTRYESRLVYSSKHYGIFSRSFVFCVHVIGILFRILTISFFFKGSEKSQRRRGYIQALKLYLT